MVQARERPGHLGQEGIGLHRVLALGFRMDAAHIIQGGVTSCCPCTGPGTQ